MAILLLLLVEMNQEFLGNRLSLFEHRNPHVRTFAYAIAAVIMLMFGVFDGGQFIYFQFEEEILYQDHLHSLRYFCT